MPKPEELQKISQAAVKYACELYPKCPYMGINGFSLGDDVFPSELKSNVEEVSGITKGKISVLRSTLPELFEGQTETHEQA